MADALFYSWPAQRSGTGVPTMHISCFMPPCGSCLHSPAALPGFQSPVLWLLRRPPLAGAISMLSTPETLLADVMGSLLQETDSTAHLYGSTIPVRYVNSSHLGRCPSILQVSRHWR